jgi:hypothetical protein
MRAQRYIVDLDSTGHFPVEIAGQWRLPGQESPVAP